MTTMNEPVLNLQDIPRLFTKYWVWILLSAAISTMMAVAAANHLPKKYKAHFVLTIYSKYFQSPLIGDFVPGLSESSEARSQREALIRQILTPEYLDMLGNKYHIYSTEAPHWWVRLIQTIGQAFGLIDRTSEEAILSAERESLRKRIEIYSINNTTFNVGFLYSDPDVTLKVTQDIFTQMIQSLMDVRTRIIGNVRNAIQSRLRTMSPGTSSPRLAPTEGQSIQQELAEVRQELRSLTAQYTEEHPLIMQLRDRERILAARAGHSDRHGDVFAPAPAPTGTDSSRDMYGDLAKKLNYLDIALDSDRQHASDYFAILESPLYPAAPLWPKKSLLAVWGFALGFCGSVFVFALKEYFERSTLHADVVAHQLGLPMLGEMPPFPGKSSRI